MTTPLGSFEYKNVVLVLYMMALFIQVMDSTAVNVAIPTLADHFGVRDTDVDWAIIGYTLSLAAFLPAAGWLAGRFGAKQVFLGSLALFIVASWLCGMAQTLDQLVAFRLLQGAAAGVITPVASAILFSAFPPSERARASTVIIGVVVIAPAIGPIVGGTLVEFLSWRWIFFINLPIGGLALVLSWFLMRQLPRREPTRFDALGFALAFVGMAALLFGVSEGPGRGWTSPLIVTALVAGVGGLGAFIVWQRRTTNPLLQIRLLNERLFRTCNLLAFPAYLSFMGLIFIMPLYLDRLRGFSALETALMMAPQPVGVFIGSQIFGRVVYQRVGPRRLIGVAMLLAGVNGLLFGLVGLDTPPVVIGGLMFTRGLVMAGLFIGVQTAIYAQTTVLDLPDATTVFGLVRQAAPAFGVALVATIIAARSPLFANADPTAAEQVLALPAYRTAFVVIALPFFLAAAFAWKIHDEDAAETMAPA